MYQIRSTQIKAARALLGWSQNELAEATGLSIATIRNLELGFISPRSTTMNVIREAVENAGLEFIDPEGIRRRLDEVKIFHGPESRKALTEDICRALGQKGGEVLAVIKSQYVLDHLVELNGLAAMRCVLCETAAMPQPALPFEFRLISKHYIDPVPFYVYGDRHAILVDGGHSSPRIVVFQSAAIAQAYRAHFNSLWDNAVPYSGKLRA